MNKKLAVVFVLALISIPNVSGYKTALTALGKLQTSGISIETSYKPVVPPASEVYDPQNPIYGGRNYNY